MSQQHHVKRIGLFGWGFLLFLILCVLPMAVAQNDSPKTEQKIAEAPITIKTGAAKTPNGFLSTQEFDFDKIKNAAESTVMVMGKKYDSSSYKGVGAGVVVDSRGYIMTTYHVIDGQEKIPVKTFDGKEYAAKCIAHDPSKDIALIKITPNSPLVPIRIGDSGKLKVLERIVLLGHPYGYEFSFSSGEISAFHREIDVTEDLKYFNMIQISANINPGDSGGPLMNMQGEMIGIAAALRQNSQIAFAMPGDYVLEVGAELLNQFTSKSCEHGIRFKGIDANLIGTDKINGKDYQSLVVDSVEPDSPAQVAGVQAGDVLLKVNDITLARKLDFYRSLVEKKDGEIVQLLFERNGEKLGTKMTLGKSKK